MRADLTDITILLDASTSMRDIMVETCKGFNEFIEGQKLVPGECLVSLYQFQSRPLQPTFVGRPLSQVPLLIPGVNYQVGGMTAYLDAKAQAIQATGARLAAMPEAERPCKVIFISFTDGEENASMEFSHSQGGHARVKAMQEHQESKYSWSFILIGQDYDPAHVGEQLGYNPANVFSVRKATTAAAYASMSKGIANVRMSTAGLNADGTRAASGDHIADFATACNDARSIAEIAKQKTTTS